MTMCCAYLNKKKEVLRFHKNTACFVGVDHSVPPDSTFFRFYVPLEDELMDGTSDVSENGSSISQEERTEFVYLIKKLYDFEEHFQEIGPKEAWVDFDLRKTSGFRIFAICTCLRYINEFSTYIRPTLRLRKLGLKEKESFLFAHYFLWRYSDNHSFFRCLQINPEKILENVPQISPDVPFLKKKRFLTQSIWITYCGKNNEYYSNDPKVDYFPALLSRVRKSPTSFMILHKLCKEYDVEVQFIHLAKQVKGFITFAKQKEKFLGT